MNPKVTRLPGFPKPPADVSPQLRGYLEALSEALDIRLGRRGDPVDRAVTLRELINSGLAKELLNNPFDPNLPQNPGFVPEDKADVTDIPHQPTGFTANGAYSVVNCRWDFANYSTHNQTEIHSHTSDVRSDATLTGVSVGQTYLDPVGSGVTRYYWVRHVSIAGVVGPWNAIAGTVAQTAPDVEHLLGVLTDAINLSNLSIALRANLSTYQNATQVNNIIDTNTNDFQSGGQVNAAVTTAVGAVRGKVPVWIASGTYAVDEVVRSSSGGSDSKLYICISAVSASTNDSLPTTSTSTAHWKLYGDYYRIEDSANKITQVNLISASSTSAAAQSIAGLNSILKTASGDTILSATNLSTMKSALFTDPDATPPVLRASAAQIDYLNAFYSHPETGVAENITMQQALEISASNVHGLRGQYTVKIDANGHVAGFGLANTTTATGANTSEFFINADRFAIMPPVASSITANWSGGTTYAAGNKVTVTGSPHLWQARVASTGQIPTAVNSVFWDNISTVPFVVQASGVTESGTYVPPGVYINNAMIRHASITSAQIGSVNADTIETGDLLVTRLITAGEISTNKLNIGGSTIVSTPDPSTGVHFLQVGAISITTAHIRDAAIETLKLAGNAVTVQDAAIQASNITLGFGNSSSWTTIVTDTFNPAGGGFVATFTGQLTITDDSRADFRMKVNGTVRREWNTGMRADSGSDVEGEMSSVMGFAMSSTAGNNVNVTIEGKYYSGAASIMKNGCLTIDGSKR